MTLPNSNFLKGVGIVCIVLGFVEIGLGAEVWAYVPGDKYGSWWAAMIVVVAGIFGVIANNKMHVQLMVFFSTMASILSFSGMLVDSFGYRRVNDLETCVDTVTNEWVGASGMQPEAAMCATETEKLCACVGSQDVCHFFDINVYRGQNCELILTKYTDLLLISAIFTTFCLAWVFVLAVMGCVTLHTIDCPASAQPKAVPQAEPASPAGAVQMTPAAAPAAADQQMAPAATTETGPESI